jgi:N-acetyl-anhydromuramyl-L-alanine amidase AmpD
MALEIKKDWRLPDAEYFKTENKKSGICIHHTVGGSARSTFNWWTQDSQMVGTAYIIDHDGSVYNVFDPENWAWQFGLRWDYQDKIAFEKRFIGIEIASEGGLLEEDGKCYCFDRISPKTEKPADEVFDAGFNYRGYRYFDRYEPEQIDSLVELINFLCDEFDIPRRVQQDSMKYYGEQLKDFEGIIGHTMVRKDKSDPAPVPELWERLIDDCNLVTISEEQDEEEQTESDEEAMNEQEIDELFEHNARELNKMDVAAGSMVKGLIMELERNDRNTYIKLRDATPDGHTVHYDFIEGQKDLIGRIGKALGFKRITEDLLEVRNG